MAVKIRLARRGRKKAPRYDIVVADAKAPRDGRFIEKVGTYNPTTHPATVVLKADRALDWLMKGAEPTDTARTLLSHEGVMFRKHLQVGVNKGAITQDQADEKYEAWRQQKDTQIQGKSDGIAEKKAAATQVRMTAETKKKEDRAQAIIKKNTPPAAPVPVAVPAEEETNVPEAVTEQAAPIAEEVPETATEPTAAEPTAAEPTAAEPTATEPTATEPTATEPTATAEVIETVAEAPVAEAPVAEVPVAEVPVAEAPVAEVPVAEVPVAETPVVEETVAQETVAEAPAAKAPEAETPEETTIEEKPA